MNNDNFMVFVYNAIIALFAFFVAAPMLLNAISLFTVQKRFAKGQQFEERLQQYKFSPRSREEILSMFREVLNS